VKIRLLAFGKLRFPGYRSAADEYLKRITPWAKIEEIELKAVPIRDQGAATAVQVRAQEASEIERWAPAPALLILLDEGGKAATTEEWATRVRGWEDSSREVVFAIGGSLGFDPALKKRAQSVMSLGPQTLSHELARVVLLEQIYRALSVLRGHPYHNP
jgi:23S rRNA (pseudouridine1915-N3)-methyltransferase